MMRVAALLLVTLASAIACEPNRPAERGVAPADASPFSPASDAAAWSRVPRAEPPLPLWARMTIESLPVTTLLHVDLDALHRAENPLGKELSARIRFAVADANRCAYAKQAAAADLGELDPAAPTEGAAVAFARRLTLASASITDEEVAQLVERYGLDDTVGIVHTVAYANFQDRLFLALGLTEEPGGAKPPLRTRASPTEACPVPERAPPNDDLARPAAAVAAPTGWSARNFDEVQALLEQQKSRTPRVPEPDAPRLARFPRPDREQISRTAWGRVSRGYQPVLTLAWIDAMRTFGREAKLDPIFENTLFWVVTRTNDCFY